MAEQGMRNAYQKVTAFFTDFAAWLGETFADSAIAQEIRDDLGLNTDNPATPPALDPAVRQKIDDFLAKEKVDASALLATLPQIKTLVDTIHTFADAVKSDGADAWDVFWLLFKVWVADSLRVRNPSAYALCSLVGLIAGDDELLPQADPAPATRLLKGEVTGADADALIDRISALSGALVVALDRLCAPVGGTIDAMYGWDPEPGSDADASVAASRALSVVFKTGDVVNPVLTVIPVSRADGGPGLLISMGAHVHIEHDAGGSAVYTTDIGAQGAFSFFFRFSEDDPGFRAFGPGTPSLEIGVKPKTATATAPASAPAGAAAPRLVLGTSDATRLEIADFSYAFELGAQSAGFKAHLHKGKLVISLGDGDGFLSKLPGHSVEVPFELGLLADTAHGIRFDGGSGLKVDLPVAASLFGVFRVQFVALELKLAGVPSAEIRGGFSLKLGPFQASVDQIGTALDLGAVAEGADDIGGLVKFLPPRGIGLALDLGPVKGGGYLAIDAEKGEYAGALELKVFVLSIKAIALISTRRPDGSDGWSLLIFLFCQFKVHIAFGIFLTGLGGMIGLHHRADLDALSAGMRTGALDDVLFPENPVADAQRIVNRYKQLFPVESDSLLVGPMLEMSFSEPPIVYVRMGLVFEVRNALGDDRPAELTKVILLGQLLVQLPPKELGVPAVLKLLVDVVGFYDAPEQFLLIRARLRDSFVGVEGFVKLNLTGELLLAARFGDDPSFVLSAGGFHPAFKDVPRGVPANLERMAVSFGLGPIKMRGENYFAVTSNTVQAGSRIEVSADIDVAAIKGHLSFDALLYLEPTFHFLVQLEFQVQLEALGESFCSVTVRMSLKGPGEWQAKGSFSFSILWWDIDIGFDEKWGTDPAVENTTTSAAAIVRQELGTPSRLMPGPPIGGNGLVTLAQPPAGATPAHPLGQVTLAQKAVPLDVRIDRIGTKSLTEGTPKFTIDTVTVSGRQDTTHETVTDHFARGQFMELTEQQKLEGRSFETFTSGVRIGSADYAVEGVGTTVRADYEVKIIEPEPVLNLYWKVIAASRETLPADMAMALAAYGAAAGSARATATALRSGIGAAALSEPPLAVVDPGSLRETVTVTNGPASSEAIASEAAALSGGLVVEAYEAVR
ncbi:hypothetical protein GO001_18720 [Streptomyces sp. NRRL B-1677]|uniref:DUF6603 domain-containing protein n=1 Tax=Streptomyces sp. NRRL B-1677 TaxID=2682966 RepID=UPI001892AB58|nr:DUF6603 domain-containing protein [Streptomyces sp. NRRL B-1677]MBF6047247.1 hypothetical protein [Streptomyces sp. NRRL B-1677]